MLNRKCKNIKLLLPEFVEGVLTTEDKKLVENHIAKCDNCLCDISEIKSALNILQIEIEKSVPTNYFSSLPILIQERIKQKKNKFTFPIYWFRYASQLAAVFVIGIISSLYILLSDKSNLINHETNSEYANIYDIENQNHQQLIESNYYIPKETEVIFNKHFAENLQIHKNEKLTKMNKIDLQLIDILTFLVDYDNQSKSEFDYLLAVSDELSNEAIH